MGGVPSLQHVPPEDDEWLDELRPENRVRTTNVKNSLVDAKTTTGKNVKMIPSSEYHEADEYTVSTMGGVKSRKLKDNEEDLPGFEASQNIILADFSQLQHRKGFPRYDEDNPWLKTLQEIDIDNTLIVYISHCWLRPNEVIPNPDNTKNSKFNLLVEGLKRTWREHAPGMKSCYIWMDYLCLEQKYGISLARNLKCLDKIMECCDCVFTPIYDPSVWHDPPSGISNYFEQYKADSWNVGDNAFLNRGWCRLEMIYAAVIPVTNRMHSLEKESQSGSEQSTPVSSPGKPLSPSPNKTDGPLNPWSRGTSRGLPKGNADRVSKFNGGLLYNLARDQRPHLLYGNHEEAGDLPPIILPRMKSLLFDRYHPVTGKFTVEHDREIVKKLYARSRPHMNTLTKGYRGEFNASGERHGWGMYIYIDQTMYEGEWRHDKKHGEGVWKTVDGIYTGTFANDKRIGAGTHRLANGAYYEGTFVGDLLEGAGVHHCHTGDTYVGNYHRGKKHGDGTFTFGWGTKKGDVYIGEFFEDQKSGKGLYTYADGAEYRGQWQNDKKHGVGVYKYASTAMYEGEFKDGLKHGTGIYYYTSGDIYEGEYKAGKMHGKGKYNYVGDTVFEGTFNKGQRHGPGMLLHANGDSFEGTWKDNKKIGPGIYKHKNGALYYPDVHEHWNFE